MKSGKLLVAISLGALTAGCVSGPKEIDVATPVPAVSKEPEKLAPDIQKILAAGGLDPANPSGTTTADEPEPRAVALALAQTNAPKAASKPRTKMITLSEPERPKVVKTTKPAPRKTQVAKTSKPVERRVTRF